MRQPIRSIPRSRQTVLYLPACPVCRRVAAEAHFACLLLRRLQSEQKMRFYMALGTVGPERRVLLMAQYGSASTTAHLIAVLESAKRAVRRNHSHDLSAIDRILRECESLRGYGDLPDAPPPAV